MIDLMHFVDTSVYNKEWNASDQLVLMLQALPSWQLVAYLRNANYHGDECWIWKLYHQFKPYWAAIQSGFGSCSGCDLLEGSGAQVYLEETLREARIFPTLKQMLDYFQDPNCPPQFHKSRSWFVESTKQLMENDHYGVDSD